MPVRYRGLPAAPFEALFERSNRELAALNARRVTADEKPGYPCRISLEDAEPGETLILLSYAHQPVDSPFRASGPIFIRECAREPYDSVQLPPVFTGNRLLSVRAYSGDGMMLDAAVTPSADVETVLEEFFSESKIDYAHIHYANRGCYAARVERA